MESFLAYTINGLVLGSTYALTAIGYSMVYGILELVNFTHSTIYMVGAYLFYIFVTLLHIPMPLSFIFTILATGAVGALNERLTIRPLRAKNRPKFAMLICTIGTSIVLQNVFTVLLLAAFTFFINRTKLGMAMRACAQDTEATELMGVSVDQVVSMTFFIGSALAAVAGIMGCMSYRSVDCSIGAAIGTKTFASTVLGGIGGVLGGLIIGLTEVYTAAYIGSNYRNITAFIILILVLFLKPSGLLGKKVIKKV